MLGHGTISEFSLASIRGGGVQNVGSPFISGVSFSASVTDLESVTGAATFAVTTAGAPSFTIGTETVTASANVSPTTAGVITSAIGEETAFALNYFNIDKPRVVSTVANEVKQVMLVDHNEAQQSADDIEKVEVLSVVDHHRIANFQTANPLYLKMVTNP